MFSSLTLAPSDPIFAVNAAYNDDKDEHRINLSIGAYRDSKGQPVVFDSVKEAGRRIYASDSKADHEYLAIDGSKAFINLSRELLFGPEHTPALTSRCAGIQALSGTGSLYLIGSLLKMANPKATVYVSDPTWVNHIQMFGELFGFEIKAYPYWDASRRTLDFDGFLRCLKAAPDGSIFILHACAHNPTGQDPSHSQWQDIVNAVNEKGHFALIDSAYQGFASTLDADAYSIRLFAKSCTKDWAVCQSFAKNMGLYGERIGCLHVVCQDEGKAAIIQSRLKRFARVTWSNPPRHGSDIVTEILKDPALKEQWISQLHNVAKDIASRRDMLRSGLEKRGTPGTWNHITDQIGMFSYTGLSKAQCQYLRNQWHVYLLDSGRISMAGVNEHNVNRLCEAIDDAVRKVE